MYSYYFFLRKQRAPGYSEQYKILFSSGQLTNLDTIVIINKCRTMTSTGFLTLFLKNKDSNKFLPYNKYCHRYNIYEF